MYDADRQRDDEGREPTGGGQSLEPTIPGPRSARLQAQEMRGESGREDALSGQSTDSARAQSQDVRAHIGGGGVDGATEGAETEGGETEGGETEGGETEGAATEGAATEGGETEGAETEGAATEGGETEGAATEGAATEGAPAGGPGGPVAAQGGPGGPAGAVIEGDGGGGAGGGPTPVQPPAATPDLGNLPQTSYQAPAVAPEEAEQITAQTGMAPEAHAAQIQAGLDRIRQTATERQRAAVAACDQKATETGSALDSRAQAAQGRVDQASLALQGVYGQARTTVTGAATTARGQVTTDGTSAEGAIATSAEQNKAQAQTDYAAYGQQVEALTTEWLPVFQALFTEAGTACVGVAREKAGALATQTAAIEAHFKASGNPLQSYLGQVRASIALTKVPEAAAAMQTAGGAQKTTIEAEGGKYGATVRGALAPLTAKAIQVGTEAQATVDQAKTSAEQRLAAEKLQVGQDIDGAEQGALETLTADEQAAAGEITAIGGRIVADITTRKEDARNRFTELGATLAERYTAYAEQVGGSLPQGEFVPYDAVEPTLAGQTEGLESLHQGVLGEVEATHSAVLGEMNASVDEQLRQLDQISGDATGEAERLATEKADAIGASAAKFGEGMVEIGSSIDTAMAQYTAPTQASLEQHKSECIAELTRLKGTTKTTLDARVTQYGTDLDAQNTGFAARIEPQVIAAARTKEIALEGRAKKAYSAMRGMGTDENGVYDALRGLEPGQPGALRHVFAQIAGSSLDSWLRGDLDEDELAIANAHLALNHAVAARLEIADNVNWYGDDEAQIEKVLRGLPETERAKIANSSEWDSTRELLANNLDGTDLDVTDALMANKVHRADALRLREKIEAARRKGDNDAVHAALEGIPAADMEKVAQEFAHIQGAVDLDAGETIAGSDARSALVDFTTEEKVVGYDPNTGEPITQEMTGANKDLAEALIINGAGSMESRVARLEVENTRAGGPKDENIEKALYASPEIQEALHSQDPARVAEAQKLVDAQKAELARMYGEKYGTPGEDNTAALDTTLAALGDREDKGAMYTQMFGDGFNSPEVAKLQIKAAVDGAGTDEEAIKRALTGMHPDEIAQLRRIYPELENDLGTNGNGGFFTELSGQDRMDVEIALLGDEKWMNDQQRFELARKKYDWQRGSESTALGRDLMGGTIEAEQLDKHFASLEGYQSQIVDGKFQGSATEYEEYRRTCRYVGITAALYQEQADRVANGITTGLAITGAVIAAGLTGGAASPLIIMAVTAGTGAASMGTNYAMKGGRYGWENAAKDLGMTVVNTAVAGGGAHYLKGLGEGVTLTHKVGVGAGSGFINSSAATAMEDKTWRDGFGTGMGRTFGQGVKGGLVGGVTAYGANRFEATRIGKKLVESHSPILRGTGKAMSGGIGGFGGSTTGVAVDAVSGNYKGTDLSLAFEQIGTETAKSTVQGFFEGMAEAPRAKQNEIRREQEIAERQAQEQARQAETDAAAKLEAGDVEGARTVEETVERLTPPAEGQEKAPDAEIEETGPGGKTPQDAFEETLETVKTETDETKRTVVEETQTRLEETEQELTRTNAETEERLNTEAPEAETTPKVEGPEAEVEGAPKLDGPEAEVDSTKTADPVEMTPEQTALAKTATDMTDDVLVRLIALETEQNGNPLVTEMVMRIGAEDIGRANEVLTLMEQYTALIKVDPRSMSPEEMTTVLRAHVQLSEHASPDFLRKVIPQSDVIKHIEQQYQTMRGSVGDPLNTEGLDPGQKVEVLGLDYLDTRDGSTPYVNEGDAGTGTPVDELFFIDSNYSDGMKEKSRIPVDQVIYEFAQTSQDPEIQKLFPQLASRSAGREVDPITGESYKDTTDPYTGTGGTAPGDRLSDGLIRTNQERILPTGDGYYGEKYGTGTQIKYQGPDGAVIVIATFVELPDRTIVQMNPDLPPELRAKLGDTLDPGVVQGQ